MTHDVRLIPALALGVAALVSFSAATRADAPAPAVSGAADSAEPAPTPRTPEAAGAPAGSAAEAQPPSHAATRRHVARHYAWRHGRRYYGYRSDNPIGEFAYGVVGGAADLGSMAAYPFYCFPNYGHCHVRLPYRP